MKFSTTRRSGGDACFHLSPFKHVSPIPLKVVRLVNNFFSYWISELGEGGGGMKVP